MILFMFFAQFYGVLQLSWLGSLTRTVRWRLLLLALLAGVAVVMPVTLLLELGGARLYGLVTDQAFVIALRDNSYTIDPFLEEGLKILPLIVACMIPAIRRQLSLVDLVLLGAALGSGFGLAEAFFNFNSSIDQASYIREGDIWAFAGSIFAFVAIPGVGRTLISWLPAGASIMDPSDVVTYGALQVNSHLVWSALVGLGLGLLLRLRPRWKWIGLLPIVLMG
ncbi:MAG: PrsW family intramembrane metalloprotease, partial [Ktedonobacteraceae bacterium]|nr:PrsW family intramembrane metalloprotease [Ktedonobacteraceae bacterium]